MNWGNVYLFMKLPGSAFHLYHVICAIKCANVEDYFQTRDLAIDLSIGQKINLFESSIYS